MPIDVQRAARELRATLAREATLARAEGSKQYLKSTLTFLGASVPTVRRTAKAFVRANHELERRELAALTRHLWRSEVHELRSAAIGILELCVDALRSSDAKWLLTFVRSADTWAHVDWLAIKVLGPLVAREPRLREHVDAWARDDNFWVRRSALLVFHDALAAGTGDFAHFERVAKGMLREREFFIRKAIGWVLRSTVRRNPEWTLGFVERHAREMSALTFHEATRRLAVGEQRRLRRLRASAVSPRRRMRERAACRT